MTLSFPPLVVLAGSFDQASSWVKIVGVNSSWWYGGVSHCVDFVPPSGVYVKIGTWEDNKWCSSNEHALKAKGYWQLHPMEFPDGEQANELILADTWIPPVSEHQQEITTKLNYQHAQGGVLPAVKGTSDPYKGWYAQQETSSDLKYVYSKFYLENSPPESFAESDPSKVKKTMKANPSFLKKLQLGGKVCLVSKATTAVLDEVSIASSLGTTTTFTLNNHGSRSVIARGLIYDKDGVLLYKSHSFSMPPHSTVDLKLEIV